MHWWDQQFNTGDELRGFLECLATFVLDMKICIPAQTALVSDMGNAGYTGVIGLSTSHISLHDWTEHGYFQLDIYSCKPFSIDKVFDYLKQTKDIKEVWYSVYDRDNKNDFQKIKVF